MTLRIRPALALTASVAALLATAAPAYAHEGPCHGHGHVRLILSKDGPILGDDDVLIYDIHVKNDGPDTATGVVLTTSGWYCPPNRHSTAACTRLTDPNDSSSPVMVTEELDPIAPGATEDVPVESFLPNDQAGTARTTVEVTHVDQEDLGSIVGRCSSGWLPQPDCVSDVVALS